MSNTTLALGEEDQIDILDRTAKSLKRRKFRDRGDIEVEELIQLGWIGVRRAVVKMQVQTYDDPRAFFAHCAKCAMLAGLKKQRMIGKPFADGSTVHMGMRSLDASMGNDGDGISLLSLIADDNPGINFGDNQQDAIEKMLATLPPKMRQIVKMKFIEGLSNDEISTFLECSAETVKRVCTDALNMVRMAVFSVPEVAA